MKRRELGIFAGLLLAASAQQSVAVGLGEIQLNSVLDEPLNARIELRNIGELSDLEMLVGLASADAFKVAGVDREFHLTGLRFEVDLSDSETPVIHVSSTQPITEPYLDFLVEFEWPSGKLLREYTLLLDLPTFVTGKPEIRQVSGPVATSQPEPSGSVPARSKAMPKAGSEYTVASGDSLWKIARRSRPQQYSINETMTAIQQLNPSAFINDDINLLKKGAILRLPEDSQIDRLLESSQESAGPLALSAESYQTESQVEDSQFEEAVDEASDAYPDTADQEVSSDESESSTGLLKLAAIAPGQSDGGTVASDTGEDAGSGSSTANAMQLEDDVDLVQEELIKSQRENDELKDRLANLEEQLDTMQRMAEIESETAAAIQQGAVKTEAAKPAVSQPADKENSWLQWLFYPLIVLFGLVIAVFLFFRNRQKDGDDDFQSYQLAEEPASQQPSFQAPEEVSEAETVESVEELDLNLAQAGLELEEHEEIDPVEQAGIYLDLGDSAEAENILRSSLESNENQPRVHLKLLEIYANQGDLPQFDIQRAALADLDDSLADSQAAALRESLVPEEPASNPEASGEAESIDLDQLSSDIDEIDLAEAFGEVAFDDSSAPETAVEDAAPTEEDAIFDEVLEEVFSTEEAEVPEDDLVAQELDIQATDIDVEEECATKLELAQAYIDMGDAEGAKEILDEVVSDGTAEQQVRAKEIIAAS